MQKKFTNFESFLSSVAECFHTNVYYIQSKKACEVDMRANLPIMSRKDLIRIFNPMNAERKLSKKWPWVNLSKTKVKRPIKHSFKIISHSD